MTRNNNMNSPVPVFVQMCCSVGDMVLTSHRCVIMLHGNGFQFTAFMQLIHVNHLLYTARLRGRVRNVFAG